jgi:hypothetical protein
MKKRKQKWKLVLLIILYCNFIMWSQIPPNDPSYTLFLQDDFSGTTLDNTKWEVFNDDNYGGGVQCHRTGNVAVNNGTLELTLKAENYTIPSTTLSFNYTSGAIRLNHDYSNSNNKLFKYGYIEVRANMPYVANSQMWPSIWTKIGVNIPPPWYSEGEFEMPEQLQCLNCMSCPCPFPNCDYQDGYLLGTGIYFDYGGCSGSDYSEASVTSAYGNSWHVYGMDWSPERLIWYYDGVPIMTKENRPCGSSYEMSWSSLNYKGGGIHDLVTLILRLAYNPQSGAANANLPQKMLVDYVKIYQLQNDCTTDVISTSYNFTGYDSKVKNRIELGGSGGSTTWPSNPVMSLKAKQHVVLDEGFATPTSGSPDIFIDVPGCGCN